MARWKVNAGAIGLALLLAGPAAADTQGGAASTAAPAPPAAADRPGRAATPKDIEPIAPDRATPILGAKVLGASGEDMGMIVNVLVDDEGRPRAAVIDFGGFLGVGTRKIAVDWRLLQFKPGDAKTPVLLRLGRAELQAAPEYKPPGKPNQPMEMVGPSPAETGAPARSDAGK